MPEKSTENENDTVSFFLSPSRFQGRVCRFFESYGLCDRLRNVQIGFVLAGANP